MKVTLITATLTLAGANSNLSSLRRRLPGGKGDEKVDESAKQCHAGWVPGPDIPTPGQDFGQESYDSDVDDAEITHWNNVYPVGTIVEVFLNKQGSPTDDEVNSTRVVTTVTGKWLAKKMPLGAVDGHPFGFFAEPTYLRKIDATSEKDLPIRFEKIESGETYALEVVPGSGKFYLADCDYVNRSATKAMFRNQTNGGAIKGNCLWLTYPKDLGRVLPQNCVNAKSSANSSLRLRLPGDNFLRDVGEYLGRFARRRRDPFRFSARKCAKDIPTPGLGDDSGNYSPRDPKMDSGSDSSDADVGEDEKAHWNHEFPTDTVVKIFVDEQESPTDEENSTKFIYTKVTRGWFRKRIYVNGEPWGKYHKKVKPQYLHKIDVTRELNDEYWNNIFKIGDMVHVLVHLDDGKGEMVRVVARECVDGVIGLRLAPGQKGDEEILEVDPRCLTKIE